MTTIFVSPGDWTSDSVELEGGEFHHLFRVSRLAVGHRLRVADGAGRARAGVIEKVGRDRAEVRLGDPCDANEPSARVELLIAAPKKPRAEWLVEKATELGLRRIRFLTTERGPRSFGTGSFERFRRIALSSAQQCERSLLPEITGMHEPDEIAGMVSGVSLRLILDSTGTDLASTPRSAGVAVLVGPEGGWTPAELARFAGAGFTVASVGTRILRIETAGMLAVASLSTAALTPLEGGR